MVKLQMLKPHINVKVRQDESLMLQIAELRDGKISTVIRQLKDNHINILQYPVLKLIAFRFDCEIEELLDEVDAE